MKGKVIAIEGIDGSGKTTLIKSIEDKLKKELFSTIIISTREKEQEVLFDSIINQYGLMPDSSAYMFLFQMLHANKIDRVKKAVEDGKIVIADRWDFSFFVYHKNFGFLSKESDDLRKQISRLAFDNLHPDIGIYLDVSIEKAIDRRLWRGEFVENVNLEKDFYETIQASYKLLAIEQGWKIVDANNGFEQTLTMVWEIIRESITETPTK
jgi:dTMP kinase